MDFDISFSLRTLQRLFGFVFVSIGIFASLYKIAELLDLSRIGVAILAGVAALVVLMVAKPGRLRPSTRLFSALLALTAGALLTIGAALLQFEVLGDEMRWFALGEENAAPRGEAPDWRAAPFRWPFDGVAVAMAPLAFVAIRLLLRLSFLPAWVVVVSTAFVAGLELSLRFQPGGADLAVFSRNYALVVGLGLMVASFAADIRSPRNHGFWLSKLGAFAFSAAMIHVFETSDEFGRFGFLLASIFILALAFIQNRPSLAAPGAMGVIVYLLWLMGEADFALLLSLAILGVGGLLARYARRMTEAGPHPQNAPERWLQAHALPARRDPVTFGL